MRRLTRHSAAALATAITFGSFAASSVPFAWTFGAWSLVLLYRGFTSTASVAKAIRINLGAVVLALAVCELYFRTPHRVHSYVPVSGDGHVERCDRFGACPFKNTTITHVRTVDSVPIYRTTYTMDANGLRVAPPYDPEHVQGSVLFFGCSFTFGEGVADDEAMPYVAGVLGDGRYAVYNFGFHGYGPQQMLAAFEQDVVRSAVTVPPKYIVYQAIPSHLERVAGLMSWFPHSPRYRRTADGRVVADGHLDTVADETRYSRVERFWRGLGGPGSAISETLRKSFVYDKFLPLFRRVSHEDAQLFLDIVNQAKLDAANQYPAAEFHVLLWDNLFARRGSAEFLPEVIEGLRSRGIRVHLISEVIPDYDGAEPDLRYELDLNDAHPNAAAHRLVAEYVARNILAGEQL